MPSVGRSGPSLMPGSRQHHPRRTDPDRANRRTAQIANPHASPLTRSPTGSKTKPTSTTHAHFPLDNANGGDT